MVNIIKQLREDIKNDYTSIEYMEIINNQDWTFILEGDTILYYWIELDYSFAGKISVARFMDLDDKEVLTYINSDMYYNTIEEQ